jgi:hypothetical protein
MTEKVWKQEWDKFSDDAILEMKKYSDQTHLHREWMSYVYEVDGRYELGEPSYGDESRIEVNPTEKSKEDSKKNGFNESQRKWTIHGHPLKDGKIYTGRQYFSSTDILGEFLNSRDNNEYVVQYVVYPHQQDKNGQKVIHNRVRILVFPNREVLWKAMKMSHPEMTEEQFMGINEGNGYNKNAADGSLKNEAGVDWFEFQEALGKMGYMGIMDIEGPAGGMQVDAADTMFKQSQGVSTNWAMIGLIIIGFAALMKARGSSVFGVEDGFGADFESRHWWN